MPASRQDTAVRLHSAAIRLLRWLRRQDRDGALPAAQLSALSVIVHKGPLAATALAAEEQVSGPTMTRTVQALATAGLVSRRGAADDGRKVLIAATASGQAVLEAAAARRIQLLQHQLALLSREERAILDRAADILLRMPP